MCLTPAGTAYTQAHAVHAPAACALLHAARVQCVRVKKNEKFGRCSAFVPCTTYDYDLKGFKVHFHASLDHEIETHACPMSAHASR